MALSAIMFGMVVFILLVSIVIPVLIVNTFGNGSPPLKFSYAAFALLITSGFCTLVVFMCCFQ
ncbi:hypothetical protein [Gracilibacillus xinjiangensis]|uniref:Uncharacterized protein n=1 Tax=Gracilibacillus xinjiangensis TaxID=1193282 RepID=A0ABV8WXL4_9BACI